MRSTTVIVGHGSRDAEAQLAFENWMELYQKRHPERRLRHAFLELSEPFLGEVLKEEAERNEELIVAPLSLLPAAHVKNDVPLAITALQAEFPQVRIVATQPLGVHDALLRFWSEKWEALEVPREERKEWTLLLVGRGASDVDANSTFYKMGRLLAEAMGVAQFVPAFIGITWPTVDEALQLLLRQRPKGVVMIPYFLFTGVLVQRLESKLREFQERSPWIKIHSFAPFGPDPVLCEVMEDRIEEARGKKQMPLPCVTCNYRVPLGVLQERVGGLKSLLWSLRHQLTHQQSMPHQHAHAPLEKHVLVCTNADCAAKGSVPLALALQGALRKANKHKVIKVTRTSCLGRCGEGPTVAVYPDGVWYRQMNTESAEKLVQEHLLHDRLLADHVDHVLS